jgi:hypothetical protein
LLAFTFVEPDIAVKKLESNTVFDLQLFFAKTTMCCIFGQALVCFKIGPEKSYSNRKYYFQLVLCKPRLLSFYEEGLLLIESHLKGTSW